MFSQGGGDRSGKAVGAGAYNRMNAKEMEAALSQGMDVSYDVYGNPSYTVKEGGTLKKKLQPYAASKTGRDGLNIARERLEQVTAPGSYKVADGFGPGGDAKPGKSANERLAAMGVLGKVHESAGSESEKDLQMAVMHRDANSRSEQRKGNYYAAEGAEDYMISEDPGGASGVEAGDHAGGRKAGLAPNALIRPVHADMMTRVRQTAKWSQLYKSGPSFPPKHKVLFINQDDEDGPDGQKQGQEEEGRDGANGDFVKHADNRAKPRGAGELASPALNEILSSGTHKHHNQSEFDDMGKMYPGGEGLLPGQEHFGMAQGRLQGPQQQAMDQMSNIKVFQKMKSDETQYRMAGPDAGANGVGAHGPGGSAAE